MSTILQQRLAQLALPAASGLLQGNRRGIEKESLRVTNNGFLAQTPHPTTLGSKLTHPYITTDYSEALLEFITPPVSTPEAAIQWLTDLHAYTYQHLGNEFLWVSSMPCTLTPEKDIPIADYGISNLGQMKHIYRQGLGHRYGKAMQIIAGIHFNFSFADDFWQHYQQLLNDHQSLRDFRDQQYFGIMRNFMRYSWFIILLFGASPAICRSFLPETSSTVLETFSPNTLYAPEGTSLRMSDMGYQNRRQGQFKISYNSLDEYVHDLQTGVSTLDPDFLQYGSVLDGKREQLTPNILQIEAEYYSPIRAKRTPEPNERPTHALHKNGIEYIEVRVLDLDPYEPVGINAEQLRFLESFLLFCLLQPSPEFTDLEQDEIKSNLRQTVYQGRDYSTALTFNGHSISIQQKGAELWQEITDCAQLLDQHHHHLLYQPAVQTLKNKFNHPEQLPASRILHDMEKNHDCGFFNFAQKHSKQHQELFLQHSISPAVVETLDALAQKSLEKQKKYEAEDTLSFVEYVRKYLANE